MLHTYWTSVCNFLCAGQTSSLQMVLEPANGQDHAGVEFCDTDASGEAVGDKNEVCLNASHAS
jgi:hypothetical protein